MVLNDVLRYDCDAGTWRELMTMPLAPRKEHCAVLVGARLVVFGGCAEDVFEDMACLDTRDDSWEVIHVRRAAASSRRVAGCEWHGTTW